MRDVPKKCPLRGWQPCAKEGCALFIPISDRGGWCAFTTIAIHCRDFVDECNEYGLNVNVSG